MLMTDQQYQQLMKAYNSSGVQVHAAMKAGIDPKTARRVYPGGPGATGFENSAHVAHQAGSAGGALVGGAAPLSNSMVIHAGVYVTPTESSR
jgi:hypothetical protein